MQGRSWNRRSEIEGHLHLALDLQGSPAGCRWRRGPGAKSIIIPKYKGHEKEEEFAKKTERQRAEASKLSEKQREEGYESRLTRRPV